MLGLGFVFHDSVFCKLPFDLNILKNPLYDQNYEKCMLKS